MGSKFPAYYNAKIGLKKLRHPERLWSSTTDLHGQLVSGVRAAVDDVEGRHGHQHLFDASEVSQMAVQRNAWKQLKAKLIHG